MRILIADDHAILRRGLKEILQEEFPSATIVEVGDGSSMILKVIEEEWNIVISDLSMPGRSGLDALVQIKQLAPKLPVLILSIYPEEQYAIRVLKAGAAGYLSKDMAAEQLINAVHRVLAGRKYITERVAERLVGFNDTDKPLHQVLSDREFHVLKFLSEGKSVSEIAAILHISVNTASTYRSRILQKMNMKTNAELIHYAIQHKLL